MSGRPDCVQHGLKCRPAEKTVSVIDIYPEGQTGISENPAVMSA